MVEHKVARPDGYAVIAAGDEADRPFLTWFGTEEAARKYAATRAYNDAKAYTVLKVTPVLDILPQQPVVADLRKAS